MQTQNRLLDDLARLANGAAGLAGGLREEIEGLIKHRLDRLLADMDLVTREEFDAVKDMAAAARAEQETLGKRLAELEARLAALGPSTSAAPDKD
ncbi:MAG: accessory factor UbiK family protein [Alphaproteobacteria bacterium]|nr:accessory factor UbiK family protein [Alphaproteobacteria bacterium]MCZ6764824.1 accessory factor UbiK family protein [Alphaproteobacteria bacterium]